MARPVTITAPDAPARDVAAFAFEQVVAACKANGWWGTGNPQIVTDRRPDGELSISFEIAE